MVFFEKCCFCVPLRPGCLVVAYLNLIGTIAAMLFSIYTLILGKSFYGSYKSHEDHLGLILISVSIALIIILTISLAFSIVLLVGLHQNKPGHVKAYLIFSLVFLILFAILILVKIMSGLGVSLEGIVNLLITLYFLLVIRSYHMKMLEDKHGHVQKV